MPVGSTKLPQCKLFELCEDWSLGFTVGLTTNATLGGDNFLLVCPNCRCAVSGDKAIGFVRRCVKDKVQ